MSLLLTMLPAAEGDALWIQWGPDTDRRQMIVDMGVHATGRAWQERLQAMPVADRKFDLLVLTHVDTDHIYGFLSGMVDPDPLTGFEFEDVWFNGWAHLKGESAPIVAADRDAEARRRLLGDDLEPYGGRQGEQASIWLRDQPWNAAFTGGPVVRPAEGVGPTIELAHKLTLTVLGPTQQQLSALKNDWRKAVKKALESGALDPSEVAPDLAPPGLEPMGRRPPTKPSLESATELQSLADRSFQSDETKANGSSIVLMLEYGNDRVLLAGDAHPAGLVSALGHAYPDGPPDISAFKLPHHGSQKNVSRELIESVRCNHWLVSTNGVKHYHPDAAAIARVLVYGEAPATAAEVPALFFNEPSTYNQWWNGWRAKFHYRTFCGTEAAGLTLKIEEGVVTSNL